MMPEKNVLYRIGPRAAARLRQSFYMPVLAGATAIMFARVLLMARLLGVEQFGELGTALIVSNLISTAGCFGVFTDLQRRLPVHLEFRRFRAAASQMAFTVIASVAVALAAFCLVLPISLVQGVSPLLGLVGVVHGFSQQLFLIASTESRSIGEPLRYSWQNLLRSLVVVALTVPIALLTDSAVSVLLSEAVVAMTVSVIIFARVFQRFSIATKSAFLIGVRRVRTTSWPSMTALTLISLTGLAVLSVDRWLAAALLDQRTFALYAFASIVITMGYSVQAIINASIYPALAKRLAIHGHRAAFRLTLITSAGCLLVSCLLTAPALLASGPLIAHFYPKYIEAVPLVPILMVAAILRLSDFWTGLLVVGGSERAGVIINVVALLTNVGAWYLLTRGRPASATDIALLAAGISVCTYILCVGRCWYDAYRAPLR